MSANECDSCSRQFTSWEGLWQHMEALDHGYECEYCDNRLRTEDAVNQHMDAKGHRTPFGCDSCDARFRTEEGAGSHMDAKHHRYLWQCGTCHNRFRILDAVDQHMRAKGHVGRIHLASSTTHPSLEDCDGLSDDDVPSSTNSDQLVEPSHKPTAVACPYCEEDHASVLSVVEHVESSLCPTVPGMNRHVIYSYLRQWDEFNIVTERLPLSYLAMSARCDPSLAWNGSAYICHLCRGKFSTASVLRQHVSGPAHQPALYHCPDTTGRCSGRKFMTLFDLMTHCESESCGYSARDGVGKRSSVSTSEAIVEVGYVSASSTSDCSDG